MEQFTKKIQMNSTLTALVYAGLGFILLIWPGAATNVLNTALGLVLAVIGGIDIAFSLSRRDRTLYSSSRLIVGAAMVVFGIWLLIRPELLAIIIPRVIGVLICIHGAADIGNALMLHHGGYSHWTTALILRILTIVFGSLLIFKPFSAFTTVLRFIGAFLLYDGISDLWITSRISGTFRPAQHDTREHHAVDVDYQDIPDDKKEH